MEKLGSQLSMRTSYWVQFLICLLTATVLVEKADADVIDVSRIAEVFGYPKQKLTVRDLTQESQERYGSEILASYKVESLDRTFAPMIFVISRKGLILTKELESQITAWQSNPSVKGLVRRIELGHDAYGYICLGGVGPGGTEEMIMATLRNKGLDVQVKLWIPGDELLNVVPETESYHRLIAEGGEELAKKLIECTKLTVALVAQMPTLTPILQPPQPIASFAAAPSHTSPVPPVATPSKRQPPVPLPTAAEAKSTSWPWITCAILLLALLGGIVFKLRRK